MYPIIDKEKCAECGTCLNECAENVFNVDEGGVFVAMPEKCTGCGDCDEYCLQGAITFD